MVETEIKTSEIMMGKARRGSWRENEIKWDVEYGVQQEREARACEGLLVWT